MDSDKKDAPALAKEFIKLGFEIVATSGTYKTLLEHGVEAELVYKISEGGRPNIEDLLKMAISLL